MNYSAQLLNVLAASDTVSTIVIAPNAPPVSRTSDGIRVAMNVVLDAADVLDTLTTLRAQGGRNDSVSLSGSGTFVFGIRDVGRIRVSHVTQRGSKVARITRIPFRIPDLDAICENAPALDKLLSATDSSPGTFVAVCGPSSLKNGLFVYSLLNKINQTRKKLLFILERALTFLMAHGNSIVVQTELSADVKTLEDGMDDAFLIEPDLIYVGDVRLNDQLPGVTHAIQSRISTVVSSATMDGCALLNTFILPRRQQPGVLEPPVYTVKVTPVPDGRVSVDVSEAPASG